jgi:hypothetical protein
MKRAGVLLLIGVDGRRLRRGTAGSFNGRSVCGESRRQRTHACGRVILPDQVRNEFSTTLVANYQVLEVAIYPQSGSTVDICVIDFALRVDGRLIRPAEPRTIAVRNQKQASRGGRDIALWPSVGFRREHGQRVRTSVWADDVPGLRQRTGIVE